MDERDERIPVGAEEALLDAYLERQSELERLGIIPSPRWNWLARPGVLEWMGGTQIAFFVACFSVFLTFLLFNFLFHFGS